MHNLSSAIESASSPTASADTPAPAGASATTGTSVTTGTFVTTGTSAAARTKPKMSSALSSWKKIYSNAEFGVDELS